MEISNLYGFELPIWESSPAQLPMMLGQAGGADFSFFPLGAPAGVSGSSGAGGNWAIAGKTVAAIAAISAMAKYRDSLVMICSPRVLLRGGKAPYPNSLPRKL